MALIKTFLTGVLNDCFKHIYAYLNEEVKVCECYSCLKMMIQAHLYVGFFPIFCIEHALLKQFYLYMKLLQSSTIYKQKLIMECLAVKFLHEIFYNSRLKKYNCNSSHNLS